MPLTRSFRKAKQNQKELPNLSTRLGTSQHCRTPWGITGSHRKDLLWHVGRIFIFIFVWCFCVFFHVSLCWGRSAPWICWHFFGTLALIMWRCLKMLGWMKPLNQIKQFSIADPFWNKVIEWTSQRCLPIARKAMRLPIEAGPTSNRLSEKGVQKQERHRASKNLVSPEIP